jgi:hypothetical protein
MLSSYPEQPLPSLVHAHPMSRQSCGELGQFRIQAMARPCYVFYNPCQPVSKPVHKMPIYTQPRPCQAELIKSRSPVKPMHYPKLAHCSPCAEHCMPSPDYAKPSPCPDQFMTHPAHEQPSSHPGHRAWSRTCQAQPRPCTSELMTSHACPLSSPDHFQPIPSEVHIRCMA